jgi:hypothetical protein
MNSEGEGGAPCWRESREKFEVLYQNCTKELNIPFSSAATNNLMDFTFLYIGSYKDEDDRCRRFL